MFGEAISAFYIVNTLHSGKFRLFARKFHAKYDLLIDGFKCTSTLRQVYRTLGGQSASSFSSNHMHIQCLKSLTTGTLDVLTLCNTLIIDIVAEVVEDDIAQIQSG